ncbi:MAG: zinc-binding dehydrogenase, partial [Pirellulaceae bacterium]
NVGGPITDAVFPLLPQSAHVAICGQISQYNAVEVSQGPRLLWHLIVKRATVRGFLVLDFAEHYRKALSQLTRWYREGKLNCRERVTDGIENAPRAFIEMMQGANIGKQLVKI